MPDSESIWELIVVVGLVAIFIGLAFLPNRKKKGKPTGRKPA